MKLAQSPAHVRMVSVHKDWRDQNDNWQSVRRDMCDSLVHGFSEQIGGRMWIESIMVPGHDERRSQASPDWVTMWGERS